MNDRPDEELISAYLDGELTGDQRRSVEKFLEDDPSAREVLEDYSDVSQMIRELPRPAAPSDLRETVLTGIRAASRPAASQPVAVSTRSRRLYWIASASAAVLIGVIAFPWLGDLRQDAALREIAGTPESMTVANNDAVDEQPGHTGGIAAPQAEALWPESAPPGRSRASNASTSVVDAERLRPILDSVDLPIPGEKLHDLVSDGDEIILVEYTVVDVQNMFGSVQVVLAENGIERFGDSEAEADKDATDRLYGIYVDAPDETLLAALDAIQTLDGVVSVVTTSVNEASENASPGDRRLIASAESQAPADDAVPAPPLRAAASEEAPDGDSSATPENRRDRSPREEPQAASDSAAAATDAYQLPVPLSNNVVEKMVQGQKPSISTPAALEQSQADVETDDAGDAADASRASRDAPEQKAGQRRRVVIVFVESTRTP